MKTAVPLCSGMITSNITAFLFAAGPAFNIETICAKKKANNYKFFLHIWIILLNNLALSHNYIFSSIRGLKE
ncbi:MAG: hypothetical protein ACFE9S_07170 [Candidatus Hermodarchaeota archaeon]